MRERSLWRITVIQNCTVLVFYETVTLVRAREPVPKIKASKVKSVLPVGCFKLSRVNVITSFVVVCLCCRASTL